MPEKKTPPGQEKKEAAPQGKDQKEAPPQEKEKKEPPAQAKDKDKQEPPRPQEPAPPPQQTQPQQTPPQPAQPQQTQPPQQQSPSPKQEGPTPWPETKPDKVPPPAPPPGHEEGPRATLQFLVGWEQRQQGQIRPGGKLVVGFDPARLPQCRQSSHGAQVWDIEVGMVFRPGGQWFVGSVMKKVRMPNSGPIVSLEPQPYEVTVPADATHVEMWFKNYTTIGGQGCEAWDSRYCQNYWFTVARG